MSKVALISDIHIGNTINRTDVDIFHNIHLDYAKWLKTQLLDNNVQKLIIAGDFFESRTRIDLKTLDIGHQFLDILQDFDITISSGNHDCYYLDNSKVTSISVFKTRKNVTIVDDVVETIDGITYCPWGTTLDQIPECRILVGHWDCQSFEMSKGKISTHGLKVSEMMKKCEIAFSGHYHKRQERTYNGRRFTYLGSPCQLSFGEAEDTKYVHILDTDTLDISLIENTVSPTFKYIREEADLTNIRNNFISIVSDDQTLKEKVCASNPLFYRTEVVDKLKTDISDAKTAVEEFKVVDVEETVDVFCNNIKLDEFNLVDGDQKVVADRIKALYNSLK